MSSTTRGAHPDWAIATRAPARRPPLPQLDYDLPLGSARSGPSEGDPVLGWPMAGGADSDRRAVREARDVRGAGWSGKCDRLG